MAFKDYKQLKLNKIATEILAFWETEKIFEKSVHSNEDSTPYVFYEGPPSANGLPGIHHVMARTIKDIFCRYKTQKGFKVERKAGWDTHGLPVELGVEKELNITKEDIGEKISIEKYNSTCKSAVMRYTDVWNELTKKIGFWVDMNNPYITYKTKYIESVWWLLKEIYNKGLIYKGYTVQPYSPKAGTGLSSHELNQPGTYRDVTDVSITAMFKVIKDSLPDEIKTNSDLFFLAWTTTPWTLPSNTALTISKKINYVVVDTFNLYTKKPIRVLLAKDLINTVFDKSFIEINSPQDLSLKSSEKMFPFLIINEIKGDKLIDIRYEKVWEDAPAPYDNPENAYRVISGDFVTTDEGTGIVHTAPTFGADDALAASQASPPVPPLLTKDVNGQLVPLVNLQGRFIDNLKIIGGKYVKNEYYEEDQRPERSVDVEICIHLKEKNRAFKVEKYIHSYPNCWRTDKPILYYPLDSWFIGVSKIRNKLVSLNKEINWVPKSTGEKRFSNWLSSANDWNLSRSRYWGIPLPIWRTIDKSETKVIGSVNELRSEIIKSVNYKHMEFNPLEDFEADNMGDENYDKIDLHKDTVDNIILSSSDGKPMYREKDLIDVWFDSGAMPYAQVHYPFENKDLIDKKKMFPADYIAEGVDQTRGWFYTLHVISTIVFDSISYKNVISNGLVLDKNGQKMSKRLGNSIDPFEIISKYGPDATRWYMISNSNPWDNLKFDIDGVNEISRKFFGTLFNTYSFFAIYANIDEFNVNKKNIPIEKRPEIDRWIISELNRLIKEVDDAFDKYDATKAARNISIFVNDLLSNWYVRLSRRRFWKGTLSNNKLAAYHTLFECLDKVCKLMAPLAPFFAERLFLDLNNENSSEVDDSVHLTAFPSSNAKHRDIDLEKKMNYAREVSSLALSIRKRNQIKVRQPLKKIIIPVKNILEKKSIESVSELICSEINVKKIEIIDDSSEIIIKYVKPNLKILGPKYGSKINELKNELEALQKNQIDLLEKGEIISINIFDEKINIAPSEVLIEYKDIEGWVVANNDKITVALDTRVNERLLYEGLAREFINRIQNLRKQSGFEVTDKIILYLTPDKNLEKVFVNHLNYIKNEVLAKDVVIKNELRKGENIEYDQIKTFVELYKINT
ncbi:MAG: isoleucine--tRNA ligase [Flavobacteriales bacterium]|nr:MAG: isoleucine--tRNA ligase [Flavobacteriales bacterium]|tara:strand:- start:2302 stop:5706 length:3405 start_codon:yes stop_codon:yes gene_type:complete